MGAGEDVARRLSRPSECGGDSDQAAAVIVAGAAQVPVIPAATHDDRANPPHQRRIDANAPRPLPLTSKARLETTRRALDNQAG